MDRIMVLYGDMQGFQLCAVLASAEIDNFDGVSVGFHEWMLKHHFDQETLNTLMTVLLIILKIPFMRVR